MQIERAVVISLPRDSDRLDRFYQALPTDWPFPVPERFDAIDGSRVPAPPWWVAGDAAWGCFRSHQCVIEQAINDGVESLLVLEDDALCHSDFGARQKAFFRELPHDWQWVYLGGQHIEREKGLPIRISDHVYRPFNAHRAHAYAFCGQPVMRQVAAHLHDRDAWGEKHHVDHRFGELHKDFRGGLYCPDRWLIGQNAGFSNIKQRHLEANFFPDARSYDDLRVNRPIVVVLGADRRRFVIAAILHRLGISFGSAAPPDSIPNAPEHYCAPGLGAICDQLVPDPVWKLSSNHDFRVARLRMWADQRLKSANTEFPIGATHNKLAVLLREVGEAWPNAIFISVPGSAPSESQGLESVHRQRIASALPSLGDRPHSLVIAQADFDAPEQLVQRLIDHFDINFKCADVTTAKQLARRWCRETAETTQRA